MVLIEAMSYGLPSIAFDIKFGPSHIIKNGETGFIISDGDDENYCKQLETMMINYELRKKMSYQASHDIKCRFSSNVVILKWVNLFNSLLEGNV